MNKKQKQIIMIVLSLLWVIGLVTASMLVAFLIGGTLLYFIDKYYVQPTYDDDKEVKNNSNNTRKI